MAQINNFLSHIDLEAVRAYCLTNGKTVHYVKGDCFAEAGRIGRYAGLVKSGYFKYCAPTDKGDDAVTGFSFADECIMDFTQSFIFGKPSKISITAGCDADVIQVSLRALRDYVTINYPDFIPHVSAVLLEEAYGRYLNLYQKSPSERYLELIKKSPEVLERVTLRDIASFLLITPTYLSRLRKKLGK